MTNNKTIREKLYLVIFEAETKAGKIFDGILIVLILLSLLVTALESVESIATKYRSILIFLEFLFTFLFTLEYLTRIYTSDYKLNYMKSFFGIVDLLAILPFYISLFVPGAQSLAVIRGLRVIRVFRVFKLGNYSKAGVYLHKSIIQSWPKISVFLTAVVTLVFVMGALMYLVEGPSSGFTSIPKSMYWAVVTMTTVGYGDIVPLTGLGQVVSMLLMICGYAIIAVPTGIVSAEMTKITITEMGLTRTCPKCYTENHRMEANFCDNCGYQLSDLGRGK